MNDASRLLAAFDAGDLVRPAGPEPNLVDVSLAIADRCGINEVAHTRASNDIAGRIGDADHIVLVLLDGFGMHLATREPSGSPLRAEDPDAIRTVFPSSTAPALTALATGCWPSEHAVTGWWTHLPAQGVTATILPFVDRFTEKRLNDHVSTADAFRVPASSGRFTRDTLRVMPRNIDGSTYSRYANAARSSVGYVSLRAATQAIARFISEADAPTYTYFYAPFIDNAEHEHGPDAPEVGRVIKRVRERVGEMTAALSGSARIIITADHGQIAGGAKHILERKDPLMAHLAVAPSCEPRAAAFHVQDGAHAAFAEAFRGRFGKQFALLTIDEVDELRLFGPLPLSVETRARLGDFLAIALASDVLVYEPSASLAAMRGFHGGLLPDEVYVPLIVI